MGIFQRGSIALEGIMPKVGLVHRLGLLVTTALLILGTVAAWGSSCGSAIDYGQTISCSISAPTEKQSYSFVAAAGSSVRLRVMQTSGSLYPTLTVFDPSGIQVLSAYGYWIDKSLTVATSGSYTVWIADYSGQYTGGYQLNLACQAPSCPGSPTPLGWGQTVSGTVGSYFQVVPYSFTAAAGSSVRLRVMQTSGSLVPRLQVFDPTGSQVMDRYGYSVDQTLLAGVTGPFAIWISDNSGQYTGAFQLTLTCNSPSCEPACTLTCTATAPASAQPNAAVLFQATATPSAGCTGPPTFSWSFGDGATSSLQDPAHTYATPGAYNWTVTASLPTGQICQENGTISVAGSGPGGLAGTVGIFDGTKLWPLDGSAIRSISITVTDQSGNNPRQAIVNGASYSVSGLSAGTYNLTASIIYVDNVAVSNAASCLGNHGCNSAALPKAVTFVTQASIAAGSNSDFDLRLAPPIVMLHGVWACYDKWFSPDITDQGHWDNYARSHGRIVFTPNYTWDQTSSWPNRASQVIAEVSDDLMGLSHGVTGSSYPPWYIIAHSMGGLVARVIVSGPSAHDPLVGKLAGIFELGTPNSGSDFYGIAPYTCINFLDMDSIEGYYNDNNSFQKGFNSDYPNFGSVPVQTFAGSLFCPLSLDSAFFPLPTDGVVLHASVRHVWTRYEQLAPDGNVFLKINIDNQGSPLPFTIEGCQMNHVEEGSVSDLGTLDSILGSTLATRAAQQSAHTRQGAAIRDESSVLFSSQLFTVANTAVNLSADAMGVVSFYISDTDSLAVTVQWGSASGTATLISPSGVPVSFHDLPSDEGGTYDEGGYSSMWLLNPTPGTWQVSLTSASGGPAAVLVQENGVFGLQAAVAQGLIPLGSKAHLVGVWTGDTTLVSGASETATIYDASGNLVATMPLYDDGQHGDGAPGDGTFGGETPVIGVSGHYTAVLQAEGSYTGTTFTRWASSAFDVQASSPVFTGQFADSAVDGNGTGTMDTLQESVGLNLPAAGDYTLVGDLVDGQGYPVAHAVAAVEASAAGAATADLEFYVLGSACNHFSGPLSVINLRVADGSSSALLDVWTQTLHTQIYDGTIFGCAPGVSVGPAINSLSPNAVLAGQTTNVVVSGTGFQNGCMVAYSGTGVNAVAVQWLGAEALMVETQVSSAAAPCSYDVTVTNPDGRSITAPGLLTVGQLQPPQVSFLLPQDGSTLVGNVALIAQASDDQGVSRVDFYLDGASLGTATAFPYRITWDTTSVSNGEHTLSALATDQANLSAQATVHVLVNNPCTLACSASASSTQGTAPLAVTFNGHASASALSCAGSIRYDWDFGDGSPHGSGASAAHTFHTPGSYTWIMTASIEGTSCIQTGTVIVTCPGVTLLPSSLPGGQIGLIYTQALTASGGLAPCVFTVSGGSLPTGLTLSQGGVLSGTPTAVGTYGFTVTATDANGCTGSQSYTLSVTCAYSLSSTSKSFPYKAGFVKVTVTASGQSSCGAPTVSASDPWVTATLLNYSNNKGKVKIAVSANPTADARSAQVVIGNAVFSVTQAGAPCKVTAVSPTKQTADASGGQEQIAVTATQGGCPWTASPNGAAAGWITMDVGSGSGPGTAIYTVAPNTTGKKRTGTISVATSMGKKNITVTQTP
jgi:PKD repeat protein